MTRFDDLIRSLADLMREETDALTAGGLAQSLGELAAAKLRLTTALERELALLDREQPSWKGSLTPESRAQLAQAFGDLCAAAQDNARVLARHIDLSRDLLDAVAAEASRMAGNRQETYGAEGDVKRIEAPQPLAVNTRL